MFLWTVWLFFKGSVFIAVQSLLYWTKVWQKYKNKNGTWKVLDLLCGLALGVRRWAGRGLCSSRQTHHQEHPNNINCKAIQEPRIKREMVNYSWRHVNLKLSIYNSIQKQATMQTQKSKCSFAVSLFSFPI